MRMVMRRRRRRQHLQCGESVVNNASEAIACYLILYRFQDASINLVLLNGGSVSLRHCLEI